jgi:YABBY protein
VPRSQMFMGDPVVVRCGSCTTLLRVALRPSAAPPQAMENNFMMQMRMQAAFARQQHEMRMMAMYGGGGSGSQATVHHPGASPIRQFSHMSGGGAGGGGGQMMSPHMMNAMAAQGIISGSMAALLSPRTGPSPIGEVNRARAQREPTKYNIHMRDELRRLKSDQPGLDHKEAWRLATNSWKKASNSPAEPFTMLGSMHDVQHPMASFPLDDGHHPAGLHQGGGGGGGVNQDIAAPSAVPTSEALMSARGNDAGTMAGGVKRKAPEGPIPGTVAGKVATTAPTAAAAATAPLLFTAPETQGGGTMSPPPAQRPTAAEYRQPQASPAPLPLTPVPVQGLQPDSAQWRDLSDQV